MDQSVVMEVAVAWILRWMLEASCIVCVHIRDKTSGVQEVVQQPLGVITESRITSSQ